MPFIHENFLLHCATAQRLYHDYAAAEPILDYHSHLPAAEIAGDRRFGNLFELSLEGDHYKWRVMRANAVPERYCTGDATPFEKFLAWAKTVPQTLRNPLYHWTHLELARYFGIEELLDESNARSVWDRAAEMLKGDGLTGRGILKRFRVRALCTTDDPSDDLAHHKNISASETAFRVYPTFRPDKALLVHQHAVFNPWVERLSAASNIQITRFADFLAALKQRHDAFHAVGGRLSDHGLNRCHARPCSEREASAIFDKARSGGQASLEEQEGFTSYLMLYFGHLDAERGWTKQLHLGALRNANTRGTRALGPNTGFDSIGDWPQAEALCAYLDLLDRENALPKTIVYNVNPADNYAFATAAGNFQDGLVAGKVQFGGGWWYLDQKDGIEWQLDTLSNTGSLSRFIGMLTDSRSFMSFPRHEYFRRVLCNLLGREMENGELPSDERLVGSMIRNICYDNARQYLSLEVPPEIPAAVKAGSPR